MPKTTILFNDIPIAVVEHNDKILVSSEDGEVSVPIQEYLVPLIMGNLMYDGIDTVYNVTTETED